MDIRRTACAYRFKRSLANAVDTAQTVLDVAGLVPGVGEAADLTNIAIHAYRGQYFHALLSLMSMIPTVGDIVAKPLKFLISSGKKIPYQNLATLKPYIPKIQQYLATKSSHPQLGKYVAHMNGMLNNLLKGNLTGELANYFEPPPAAAATA